MTDADAQDAVIALADALAESSERECGHALGGYPLKDWAVLMCCPRCVCRYCAAEVAREHIAAEKGWVCPVPGCNCDIDYRARIERGETT